MPFIDFFLNERNVYDCHRIGYFDCFFPFHFLTKHFWLDTFYLFCRLKINKMLSMFDLSYWIKNRFIFYRQLNGYRPDIEQNYIIRWSFMMLLHSNNINWNSSKFLSYSKKKQQNFTNIFTGALTIITLHQKMSESIRLMILSFWLSFAS